MATFLKLVELSAGFFILAVSALVLIGFTVRRFVMAAKEVIDYYLEKKREVIEEMEREFGQGVKKDFGTH